MANGQFSLDVREVLVRLLKYVFEGLVVAVAAFFIPGNNKLSAQDIILLGLIAAATFSLLDTAAPSISATVRSGAGFSIGAGLTGGLPLRA
jgi:hypothetical protein